MIYSKNNSPIKCIMKNSTCYKGTNTITPKGVLWHSTGANNTKISRYVQPYKTDSNYNEMIALLGKNKFRNDWNHITRNAGVNAWIGKLADGTITSVQTLEWNQRPWGCGSGSKGSCNYTHIQFEICEDGLNDRNYFEKVYKEACELTAYLCDMYNINPLGTFVYNGVTVPTILCHKDSYNLRLGSNHSDIYHWFNRYGKDMNTVRNDVAALMNIKTNTAVATKPSAPTNTTTSAMTIKKDTVVSIVGGAKYYNGGVIPSWVIKKNWIVKEDPKGDRVVIDKSADGKNSICSAISSKYLTIISGGVSENTNKLVSTTTPAPTPAPTPIVKPTTQKSLNDWAKEVLNGKHGNGHANREASLKKAGCTYAYADVKAKVNELSGVKTTTTSKPSKSIDEWAKEVINGKHGNGHANREASLKKAGCTYSYAQVRARVNTLSK